MTDIAIAHDYLTQKGGAERVVLAFHRMFPDAPIYTTLYNPETTFPEFKDATIITSPLNRFSIFRVDHRRALPLLAWASGRMKVKEPLAVVSSSGWAHGFDYAGKALIYCHTPARWLYLPDDYLGDGGRTSIMGRALAGLTPFLKRWDQKAARRHRAYIGNSTVVRERIAKVYGKRDVGLIFPPHSVDISGELEEIPGVTGVIEPDYLLVVSRLMPYKNVDKVIKAAQLADRDLLIIGHGPERDNLRALGGPRTFFAQDLSEAQLRWGYANSGALATVSHEDFGITPLEAAAWGKPTIALRAGGFLDSINEGVTGTYVDSTDPSSIAAAITETYARNWDADVIKAHAETFSEERFAHQIGAALGQLAEER